MSTQNTLSMAIIASLFSLPTHAENTEKSSEDNETIVVSATRTAQTVDETLSSVTVIDRKQIESSQAMNIEELLRTVAGITITNNGGMGKNTSIHMRGTNSNHVLVMIDGVRTGSATLGEPSLQFLSPAQIEKIEIVRGAKSSLYGSEAIGGIIHIFTRKGQNGHHLSAETGIGTYNTRETALSFSGKENGFHYSTAVSRQSTDGFDSRQPVTGWSPVDQPDKDGYRNNAFSIQFGKEFDNGAELSAYLQQSSGLTEFDGNDVNETEFKQASQGIKAMVMPNELWEMHLQVASSIDENDNLLNGNLESYFYTKRRTASWQNDHFIGENTLFTLGVDHQADKIEAMVEYSETERTNTGIFTQYQSQFNQVKIDLSLREDHNSTYGKQNSGQVNLGIDMGSRTQLIGGYSTAFQAPSFNDLFWPESAFAKSNPDIKPEETKNVEIGIVNRSEQGKVDIRLFRNHVTNLIAWSVDSVSNKYMPTNVNDALIKGLEIQYTTEMAGMHIHANLNFLEPVDQQTNQLLNRRSKRFGSLSLDKQQDKLGYGLTWSLFSYRYDDTRNTNRLGGYGLVDLRAEYSLTQNLRLKAKASNLFDKAHQTADTYNTAGRAFYLSIAYSQ